MVWGSITFSGIIAPEGCHSGGSGGITCCSPKKSVKKNILRISHENKHDACGHRHTEWKLNKLPGHVVIMWAGKAVSILGQRSRHEN